MPDLHDHELPDSVVTIGVQAGTLLSNFAKDIAYCTHVVLAVRGRARCTVQRPKAACTKSQSSAGSTDTGSVTSAGRI